MSDSSEMESRVAELEDRMRDLAATAADLDIIWIIISAVLVFFMQVGFAMLEVGSVSSKNTKAVLLKNIGDASLGALCWWLVGFALSFGKDAHGFIGTDMFAMKGGDFLVEGTKEAEWMFDWAFAATSVTIVSGAIAERVKIAAYVMYAIVLTSFIYPVVVHWAWHEHGWASPYRGPDDGVPLLASCGAVDFAGSSVVHMVGGTAALVAAIAVKPRRGRFRNGQVHRLPQQSPALQTLGTLILWVGWYAFNAGSTVTVSEGRSVVAARAVVSTTIGPSAAVLVMVVSLKILEKKFDTRGVNNGILSGLVAITAGAPLVNPEGAFVIGVVSAGVYYCSAKLLLKLQIDDVVDAAPVHLFCGIWGMIATGLFTTQEGWELTYGARGGDRSRECCGLFYGCGFNLLLANLALVGAVLAWVGGASVILFYTIDATVGLRVPASEEDSGMDRTRHSFTSGAGNKQGGPDAVRRAFSKAHWGFDESTYTSGVSRSQQSSRAASLSSSKHGEMSLAGVVSNGNHELAWGGGHAPDHRSDSRSSAHFGGRQPRPRGDGGYGGAGLHNRSQSGYGNGNPSMAAESVTPSVGRGSVSGFNGGFSGAPHHYPHNHHPHNNNAEDGRNGELSGAVKRNRWPGNGATNGDLGAPAPAPPAAASMPSPTPEWGKSHWRPSRKKNDEAWARDEPEEKMHYPHEA